MSNNQVVASEDSAVPYVTVNPNGTYSRPIIFPTCLPTPDSDTPVLSKDVTINVINQTGARIHVPKDTNITSTAGGQVKKLRLFVYFHGGGFVIGSSCSKFVHDFCDQLAAQLCAVVVSLDYRLAPEHRLPAAYEDGVEVLYWIKSTQDPWLTKFADLSNCYLMGNSAGANLAYHAGVRASTQLDDLEPLKIKGLILHHLFIGGVDRTDSEIRLANAEMLNLATSDMFWDLSLPVGATRDHEYSNLMVAGGNGLDRIKEVGWRVMMPIRYGDLMIDRQMGFAKILESKDIETKCFYGEGLHGVEYFDKAKAKELLDEISNFIEVGTDINSLTVKDNK